MGLKVFAPATVGNLAVGFDVLGIALDRPGDDIVIKKGKTKGLKISAIRGAKNLPLDIFKNTAGFAAHKLLEHLGELDCPIEIEIFKRMPMGSGMGSSAASAVAGVMAVNEFLGLPLEKIDLLPFAAAGEQLVSNGNQLDNLAPSLLGGIQLIRDNTSMDVLRIYAPKGLTFVIIHPKVRILTRISRSKLNPTVPLPNVVKQTANIAGFVSACYTSNFDLLQRTLKDHIIEDQRSGDIPLYDKMKEIAKNLNVLAFNISGSGPAMFALCKNTLDAENMEQAAIKLYTDHKIAINTYISGINHEGAYRY